MLSNDALKILREIDTLACEANSLWHKVEKLKYRVAVKLNISEKEMKENNIHVEGKL